MNNGYDTLTELILFDCGLGPLYTLTQLDMLGGPYFFS